MSLDGITREAGFYGDQGCIIHRPGIARRSQISFTPVAVKTTLPDAMSQPWPMGDRIDPAPRPRRIDRAKSTRPSTPPLPIPRRSPPAFVVLHKGRIVGERYMAGHHQGHAARELVDGEEPGVDALRAAGEGRHLHARAARAGAGVAEAGRSAREDSRHGSAAHEQRPALHRDAGSGLHARQGLSGSLLHLHRRGERVRLLGESAAAVRDEHRGPLSQLRSADDHAIWQSLP